MKYRSRKTNRITFHAKGMKGKKSRVWVWKRGKGGRKKELKWIYRLNYWVFALFMYITTDQLVTFSVFNFAFSIWKLSWPHYKPTQNYKTIRSPVALSVPLPRASLQWNCFLHHLGWAKDWGGGREGEQYDKRDSGENDWVRKRNKLSKSQTVGETDDRDTKSNATEQPEGCRNVGALVFSRPWLCVCVCE